MLELRPLRDRPGCAWFLGPCLGMCGVALALGCSTQRSELITAGPHSTTGGGQAVEDAGMLDDAAVTQAIAAVVNERPVGGASLGPGTSGGGAFAEAQTQGQLRIVHTLTELLNAVSGDTPTVILVVEGLYDFTLTPGRAAKACTEVCTPNVPVPAETVASSNCATTASLIDVFSTYATARVGDNKTIIGLGAGATLRNLEFDLSGSSNIIIRNLTFMDVNPGIFHDGEAIQLWPADHVWVDHCTFRNISYTSMHIASSWDEANNQALTAVAGYMTISWNHFDGRTSKACGGQDPTVLNTNRNPALTFHHNWFDTSDNWNPYLFGPGTWGHLYDNTWTNITSISVAVSCAAAALLQGNVFENAHGALYVNDNGAPTWTYCQTGLFGQVFAPSASESDEQNLFDANSPLTLNGQTTDGAGLSLPVKQSGTAYRINVPASALGEPAASYDYELDPAPGNASASVKAGSGTGHIF